MNKFFFFDNKIASGHWTNNAVLKMNQAKKDEANNPMFLEGWQETPTKPWEIRYDNAYPNVIYNKELGLYQCFYTLFTGDDESRGLSRAERAKKLYCPTAGRITSLAYAQSTDGVNWEKPNLGLVNFEGSKENNLLFRYAHGTGIMRDEHDANPERRYKMVTKVEYPGGRHFMAVNFSKDGIHWGEMIPWPKFNPAADSHNFPFYDVTDGKYKLVTRIWQDGVRLSAVCESTDFINWTDAKELIRYQGHQNQVYSMPVFQQDNLYLGLASIFHEGDRSMPNFDTVDLELAYGSHTNHFDTVAPGQHIIERGEGHYPDGAYDCGCIYAAAPIEIDGKMWVYYMAGNGQHTNYRETSLARAAWEKDKYAYYCQRDASKVANLVSQRFIAYEETFAILADIEPEGSMQVALCDRTGTKAVEGFGFDDCVLTPRGDGWYDVKFAKPLTAMGTNFFAVNIRYTGAKVFAMGGDIDLQFIKEG